MTAHTKAEPRRTRRYRVTFSRPGEEELWAFDEEHAAATVLSWNHTGHLRPRLEHVVEVRR